MFIRKKQSIKDVVLAVTYTCNSRCRFCNIWKSKESYSLKPRDYKKSLPQTSKSINLSGGEPFLREDLVDVVRAVSQRCPRAKLIISTNGFLPSLIKKRVQAILKFKRDIGVAVSIDGFGKAHEELRNVPGGFSLALETIRLLKELGVRRIKIAFTLGDANVGQLKRIYRLSRELDVEFTLSAYHNSEHFFRMRGHEVNKPDKMNKALVWLIQQELASWSPKRWLRAYYVWGMIHYLQTGCRILPDYSGLSAIFIDPFGIIYPSNVWGLEIGRLTRIRSWSAFLRRTKSIRDRRPAPASWMICTARPAMRRHWLKVGLWLVRMKASQTFGWKQYDFNRLRPLQACQVK